jgi:hypothetical protein
MAQHGAGERLAALLLPFRRVVDDEAGPGHELGWWFTDAPPAVVREALALVRKPPGERPNDQPPEEWLVTQAACRGGVLAGFAAPAGPASPRMSVDAIIVPRTQAGDLASEIARLWPLEDGGSALDLAIVGGFASMDAERPCWRCPARSSVPGAPMPLTGLTPRSAASGGTEPATRTPDRHLRLLTQLFSHP